MVMVKDIFHGKIIYIDKTGFKYRLLSIQKTVFSKDLISLLNDFEKSYSNEPYDYGHVVREIEDTLKKGGFIKNKTDFAKIIGIKNYETVSRIEKGKGCPKGRRQNSLKVAHYKLSQYLHNTMTESSSKGNGK